MVKKDKFKNELIKRYEFIVEHSTFILAPFMCEDIFIKGKPKHLRLIDYFTLIELERFLLSDEKMEDSSLYKMVEEKKDDSSYLRKLEYGLELLKDSDEGDLSEKKLLNVVRAFIIDQNNDVEERTKKLKALDEYYRINRFSNDGKIWTSGYELTVRDLLNNYGTFSGSIVNKNSVRSSGDLDTFKCGKFALFLASEKYKNPDNYSILTEEEKKEIYLKFHNDKRMSLVVKRNNYDRKDK